jgi:hypothetical protein
MTAGSGVRPVVEAPSAKPERAETSVIHGKFPPIKAWEVICAGLTFGALCFFALYFGWYFWTGTLLL